MTVIEERPEPKLRSGCEAELQVERKDIVFRDLPGDRVRISVTVRNVGAHHSPPTPMRLESAPLGAFVPWRPLARLLVPALEPGEARVVSTEATRPRPVPLGDFDRVPPKRILTAISAPDEPSEESDNGGLGILNLLGKARERRRASGDVARRPTLARDFMDLLRRGQPHWAGNINVFVRAKPVERHRAQALRIYPGRDNLAIFKVGDAGRPDAYGFKVVGVTPGWIADLYNRTNCKSLVAEPGAGSVEEMEWVESSGGLMMMLNVHPPAGCSAGEIEVHVTRRSSGETAVVEFDLDPAAQGPGCYSV
jgi:hypothetical protein